MKNINTILSDESLPGDNEGWGPHLVTLRDNAIKGNLEFARGMYAFRESCDSTQGGSTFQGKIQDWLSMSPAAGSKWCAIGEQYEELTHHIDNLPTSTEALYLMATMSPEQLENGIADGKISAEMTSREAKALKKSFRPVAEIPDDHPVEPSKKAEERAFIDTSVRVHELESLLEKANKALEFAQEKLIEQATQIEKLEDALSGQSLSTVETVVETVAPSAPPTPVDSVKNDESVETVDKPKKTLRAQVQHILGLDTLGGAGKAIKRLAGQTPIIGQVNDKWPEKDWLEILKRAEAEVKGKS